MAGSSDRARDRFRIPLAPAPAEPAPVRRSGPMGAAGREVGESLAAATEAQVEQRRRNAEDARAFREARAAGLVLTRVPLDAIRADDLTRDRLDLEAVAASEAMEELKASIRSRGQREPVELYRDARGRLQLKKGWRRLTALRALHAETGDARFAEAVARVDEGPVHREEDRVALYVDMVEENAVREDLTFAEMAALVIAARDDPRTGFQSYDEALSRLYGSLHRMKRSNVKQFVTLMHMLGEALKWPKAIGRDLGANVGRALKERRGLAADLAPKLRAAASPEAQNAILAAALKGAPARSAGPTLAFRRGRLRVAARNGELRIRAPRDFAALPRERLEAALAAFEAALGD